MNRLPEDSAATVYEFDQFRLDGANRLLTRSGEAVALPGRAFDVLLMLVERAGALVTKEEMMATVWSGSFVEESNLTVAISTLRRALGEDPQARRYIQTVARRGYRFIAEVRQRKVPARPAPVIAEPAPEPAAEVAPPAEPRQGVAASVQTSPDAAAPERLVLWPVQILYLVLVVALAAGFWHFAARRVPVRTLAVLPFSVNGAAGGAESGEVASLEMTDEIISRLETQFEVRPTSSVLRYSALESIDARAAGREQGVDAVLTGEADRTGERERLKLRLIRVSDGLTLWQQEFHSAAKDLPRLEQDAAAAVTQEMHRLGAPSSKPAGEDRPGIRADSPAYELYLRGRYFWNQRTVDGLRKSADYFRQSIAADPDYAPAYSGLADSYALLASFSVEPGSEANAAARSAALSAIQLDPALAEPHASLGMIYFFTDWNLAAAEKEFERSIQLNPNYATAHHWYALDLAAMGRFPEALYEIHTAQKLDPLSLIIGTNVGWIEYLARDYSGAVRDLRRVLELDPNFARARTRLGMVEMATGDYAAAVQDLTQALALSGTEDPWVEGLLGDAEARAGNVAGAERMLAQLGKRSAKEYVPPISRALVLLGLGRKQQAMAELERSAEDHSTALVYARVDPSLDSVRGDPAFPALLAGIKL